MSLFEHILPTEIQNLIPNEIEDIITEYAREMAYYEKITYKIEYAIEHLRVRVKQQYHNFHNINFENYHDIIEKYLKHCYKNKVESSMDGLKKSIRGKRLSRSHLIVLYKYNYIFKEIFEQRNIVWIH